MKPRVRLIQCTAVLLMSTQASIISGQELRAETLTWDDCIQIVAENNPELKSARYSLESWKFQEAAARGDYYPQLSVNADTTYRKSDGFRSGTDADSFARAAGQGIQNGNDEGLTRSGTIALTQNVFSGFATEAKVNQARANKEASGAALDSVKAKVSFDLKASFANLFYSQEYIKLSENIIRRRQENLKLVELRFEGGNENKGSYLLSKAAFGQAQFDNLQARNALVVGQEELMRVLGRPQLEPILISGAVPVADPINAPDFGELVKSNPEVGQAVAQRKAAEAQVQAARSTFYPSMDVSGNMGRTAGDSGGGGEHYSIGASVSFPLFSGGRDSNNLNSANAELFSARSSVDDVGSKVLLSLKQAHLGFVEACERANVDLEFVQAATVRAEIARHKYDNGLLSFEDWDIIENDLITRQKTSLLSQRDRVIAEASWEQAQGKGVLP